MPSPIVIKFGTLTWIRLKLNAQDAAVLKALLQVGSAAKGQDFPKGHMAGLFLDFYSAIN
jgi:hypothetical protein